MLSTSSDVPFAYFSIASKGISSDCKLLISPYNLVTLRSLPYFMIDTTEVAIPASVGHKSSPKKHL